MRRPGRAVDLALKHLVNTKDIRPALAGRSANAGIRERIMAHELAGSMIDPGQQNSLLVDMQSEGAAALAKAADAPRCAAATAAATTGAATTNAATASTTTTTTATTTAAGPGHLLHTFLATFLVKEMEGREAHVRDLFVAKHKMLVGDLVE
jgi:hypothetical protein